MKDEKEVKTEDCSECEGTGEEQYSCCGDYIAGNDIDLCPTCYEHCGGECGECGGSGEVTIQ